MRSSFLLFSILVLTMTGCATSNPPPPLTDDPERRASTMLGVAQLHGQTPFMFCDECPEPTPKHLPLPQPAAPALARIPEAPTIKRTQRWALHFSLGSSRLGEGARVMLNEIVTELNDDPSVRLSLTGHTDLVGTLRFNKRLARARTRAVRDALFDLGVSRARIEQLASTCCVEHPPTTNPGARRVDILIKQTGHLYGR